MGSEPTKNFNQSVYKPVTKLNEMMLLSNLQNNLIEHVPQFNKTSGEFDTLSRATKAAETTAEEEKALTTRQSSGFAPAPVINLNTISQFDIAPSPIISSGALTQMDNFKTQKS